MVTDEWERKKKKKKKGKGGEERKRRKCGAGSSADACGHCLLGLLTRKGKANNTGQQSSHSEQ